MDEHGALVLLYGLGGLSLRSTASFAVEAGIADVCDVSLLDRLRNCPEWLEYVLGQLLQITPARPAEALDRVAVLRGDLILQDRGYGRAGNLAHASGCWQPGSRQRMLATWLTPANQEPSSSAAARAQARRCQPCPLRHNRGLAPQRSGHCRTARRHRAQDTRNTHTPDYQAQIRRSRQSRTQAQGIQSPQQWPGQRSAHDNGRRIWGLRHIVVARRTLSRPPAAIALALLANRQKSPARNRLPETARQKQPDRRHLHSHAKNTDPPFAPDHATSPRRTS